MEIYSQFLIAHRIKITIALKYIKPTASKDDPSQFASFRANI